MGIFPAFSIPPRFKIAEDDKARLQIYAGEIFARIENVNDAIARGNLISFAVRRFNDRYLLCHWVIFLGGIMIVPCSLFEIDYFIYFIIILFHLYIFYLLYILVILF